MYKYKSTLKTGDNNFHYGSYKNNISPFYSIFSKFMPMLRRKMMLAIAITITGVLFTGCEEESIIDPSGEIQNLISRYTEDTITLIWDDPMENDFRLLRIDWSPRRGSPFPPFNVVKGTQSFTIEELEINQIYTFLLRSIGNNGDILEEREISVTTGVRENLPIKIGETLRDFLVSKREMNRYEVTLNEEVRYNLVLNTPESDDFDIYIFLPINGRDSLFVSSRTERPREESIDFIPLTGGKYFIDVFQTSGSGLYSLELDEAAP